MAGEQVGKWHDLVAIINAHPDKEITIEFERGNRLQALTVTPQRDPQTGIGLIGIWPQTKMFALFPSLRLGITHAVSFLQFIAASIMQMLTGKAAPDVVGPVGIIRIVGEVAKTGVVNLLSLAAIISLNLGFLNLLPFPALDGSRLMFLILEGVRGRPVDPQKESFVHFVGFTILIFSMIIIAYRDLMRLNIFF